jgi:hypothetical protein
MGLENGRKLSRPDLRFYKQSVGRTEENLAQTRNKHLPNLVWTEI